MILLGGVQQLDTPINASKIECKLNKIWNAVLEVSSAATFGAIIQFHAAAKTRRITDQIGITLKLPAPAVDCGRNRDQHHSRRRCSLWVADLF
jgi:hypothetical protein